MEIRAGRKILSVLLIVALSVTMLFVDCNIVSAADTEKADIVEGTLGGYITYSLDVEKGELTLGFVEDKSPDQSNFWEIHEDLYNGDLNTYSRDVKKIILTENFAPIYEDVFLGLFQFLELEEIEVDIGNTYYTSIDGVLFSKDQTILYYYPMKRPDQRYEIPDTVKTIKSTFSSPFENVKCLEAIVIPASVEKVDPHSFKNRHWGNANKIKEFVVDDMNPVYKTVDGVLFSKDCTQLFCYPDSKEEGCYSIPQTVKYIKNSAFSSIVNTDSIFIPEGVETIESYAFNGMYHYEEENFTIPASVSSIEKDAFGYLGHVDNKVKSITFTNGSKLVDFPSDGFADNSNSLVYYIPCTLSWNIPDTYIFQAAHNYGEWTTTKNPTCLTAGEMESICSFCQDKKTEVIPINLAAHSFTNYIYNNDAKVGVDGTETAVCDNGCGATDTRTKPGTALEDSGSTGGGSTGGGGGFVPPVSVQKPIIAADEHTDFELSADGTKVTIKVKDGYELEDVKLNGESLGKVTVISNLKTGDKVTISTRKKLTDEEQAELDRIERIKKGVQATILKARSKAYKGKTKVYWTKSWGYKVDGYNVYKSTKKDGKYTFMGKTKKKYMYHTKKLKKGTRYYYYVQGYRTIGNEKVYTKKSLKAIRTAK